MSIYITFIFLSFIFYFLFKRNKCLDTYGCALLFLYMLFIATFRDISIGTDFISYETIFDARGIYGEERLEVGWIILNYYFSEYYSFRCFVFFYYVFIFTSWFFFIKKNCTNQCLGILFFFLIGLFFLSFNVMRQMFAAAIFLYAFEFMKKGKFIPYLIIVCLASLIHQSILCLIPVYFIQKLDFNLNIVVIVLFSCLIISYLNIIAPVIQMIGGERYGGYADLASLHYTKFIFNFFLITIICAAGYIYPNASKNILFKMSIIGIILLIILSPFQYLSRISYCYFLYFLIAFFTKNITHTHKKNLLVNYIIILYLSFYFIFYFIYSNRDECIPYKLMQL